MEVRRNGRGPRCGMEQGRREHGQELRNALCQPQSRQRQPIAATINGSPFALGDAIRRRTARSPVRIRQQHCSPRTIVASVRTTLTEAHQFSGDLVDAIKRFGARVLPPNFDKKPYMEAPKWPRSGNITITIRAELHRSKYGTQRIGPVSSLEPLSPGHWLHFKAVTNTGVPFDAGAYKVLWRVTNTDEAAARANALRGKIENPENDNSRWEQLQYRGVHLVEAFVMLKRTNTIVGQSGAFRVMIE